MKISTLPFVSVIIVNFNGKPFLEECLISLIQSDYPPDKLEIIFVDNASTDGSVEYVKSTFPQVKLLQLNKNYGFCKPNNDAAKIAKGEYVVFLNNDTVVSINWLSELVKGVLSEKKIISCASKMLYYDNNNIINTAGGKINIIGGGFYKGYGDVNDEKYSNFEYTGFGCGAGVLVNKQFFLEIGGFDEDYFASLEEHDLGWKSWLYGYKVLYVPTAIMLHKESGSFGSKSSFQPIKVYLITRNRLYNLFKNLETKNVVKGISISICFNSYRAFMYALDGNLLSIRALATAHIDFVKNINTIIKKRKVVQQNRKRSDNELYKLGILASISECVKEERRLQKVWNNDEYKI